MTQNLKNLYNTPSITPQQSGEFNTLLSKISQNLAIARKFIQDTDSLPNALKTAVTTEPDKLLLNWHTLLSHLYDVLLPEMYVFFHDDSTNSQSRQQVHQLTFKLWQSSLILLKNIHMEINIDDVMFNHSFDNYVIGKGTNAEIACDILPIAKLSDISGFDYIESIDVLIKICRSDSSIVDFLLRNPHNIEKDLADLLNFRLTCFSQPTAERLAEQSELLLIGRNHPLINYLLDNHTQNCDTYNLQSAPNQFDNILASLGLNKAGKCQEDKNEAIQTLISDHLPVALLLTTIMSFFSGLTFSILVIFLALLMSHVLVYVAKSEQSFQYYIDNKLSYAIDVFIRHFTRIFIALFVSSFIFDGWFFVFLMIISILSMSIYQYHTDKFFLSGVIEEANKSYKDTDKHANANLASGSGTPSPKKSQTNPIVASAHILPLNIDHHAKYLKILLSIPAVRILDDLIDTVNELYEYLDYLQEEHPYLATSVHELIMDITTNSVLRLDQLAKTFVKNGMVKPRAKKLFAKQHEQQVTDLFNHHIEEIQALNQSILEKQMAGFSQTGTQAERQFRDGIMELKILLRWYIAQQPDEFSATSHQVILDRLENTTLKQMMDSFYQADTTDQQRGTLQSQIEDLLAHFKSHSPMNKIDNGDELLQLTYNPNTVINQQLSRGQQEAQMTTQEFIDFNEQYVKQLKIHW